MYKHTGLVVALVITGCGGGGGTVVAPENNPPQAALEELSVIIKDVAGKKQKPPSKLADLDKFEPGFPTAIAALSSSKIVYAWGYGYVPGGTGLVAYQAEPSGGSRLVLTEDGTVKSMSEAEFVTAQKSTKK